ncbi:MAG: S8 family serine peptidase, partial [Actinomycetales bacterium]
MRWGAPTSNGGSVITSYEARAYALASGGAPVASCTSSTLQCAISGLTNGQAMWIEVSAINAVGAGPATSPRIQATPAVGFTPNDPYYAGGSLWGLNGAYGVNAPDAWTITRGSASTVVAVLDTGSTVHPDLDGTTVPGYDMISDPAVAVDGNGRDADPSDAGDASGGYSSSWHGTHVAGTINAVASNGVGVVGVAPDVKVQPVRVVGAGGGYTSDILVGITWASGGAVPGIPANPTPARVINMSLGGYGACSPDWQSKIDDAVSRGTTVVVAAGNSNADA